MKLSRSKCVVIILIDKKNRTLFCLRDNNPNISFPGMWALIGGAPKASEDNVKAIKREIEEELILSNGSLLKLSDIKFIFKYERLDVHKTEYVFHSLLPYDLKEIIPREGVRLSLFTKAQIELSNHVAPHHKDILIMYYSK